MEPIAGSFSWRVRLSVLDCWPCWSIRRATHVSAATLPFLFTLLRLPRDRCLSLPSLYSLLSNYFDVIIITYLQYKFSIFTCCFLCLTLSFTPSLIADCVLALVPITAITYYHPPRDHRLPVVVSRPRGEPQPSPYRFRIYMIY